MEQDTGICEHLVLFLRTFLRETIHRKPWKSMEMACVTYSSLHDDMFLLATSKKDREAFMRWQLISSDMN
jgi:hypothetical protein